VARQRDGTALLPEAWDHHEEWAHRPINGARCCWQLWDLVILRVLSGTRLDLNLDDRWPPTALPDPLDPPGYWSVAGLGDQGVHVDAFPATRMTLKRMAGARPTLVSIVFPTPHLIRQWPGSAWRLASAHPASPSYGDGRSGPISRALMAARPLTG
jgi:hypothetical protein